MRYSFYEYHRKYFPKTSRETMKKRMLRGALPLGHTLVMDEDRITVHVKEITQVGDKIIVESDNVLLKAILEYHRRERVFTNKHELLAEIAIENDLNITLLAAYCGIDR